MTTDRNSEGAVAWQTRWEQVEAEHRSREVGEWSDWCIWTDLELAERDHATNLAEGFPSEFRALYTTPPASIPAAEVQALVERLRGETTKARNAGEFGRASGLEDAADELAKLIPRNPE